ESAAAVGAQAYTVGRDVVFGQGGFHPGTFAGRQLLAHELTHVLQQSAGAVASPTGVSAIDPDSRMEAEAQAVGAAIHDQAALRASPIPGSALQRQPTRGSGTRPARPPPIT